MARPKLLDMFDPSLSVGETAYTRLSSYVNASVSGDTLVVQVLNLNLQEGATLLLNVVNNSTNLVSYLEVGSRKFTLQDSAGLMIRQVLPQNSRLSVNLDSTNLIAHVMNQAIPEGIILSEDEELEDPVSINADTLEGYSAEDFVLKASTYNIFGTAEVIS